ncbi:hypothetical protein H072_965 [Dactylellina haptotyla CBS 200.50]|uniref:Phosphoribulokinase/uridine kinase domain-containing protein n=1 Tax=Dactylellina haptotyla (strain CBS 200.50) TaxID=1284197 RepID=S8AQ92_DACHA|nr:hypothetical protein H072_965 [Dactylellina haptotyla CBS 200.50]
MAPSSSLGYNDTLMNQPLPPPPLTHRHHALKKSSCPSSSGKTSLSRLLRAAFTSKTLPDHPPVKCVILHGDDFYVPDSQLPMVELGSTGEKVQDWDCPEAIEFPRFLESVKYAKAHGELPGTHQTFEDTHAVGVEESLSRLTNGVEGGKEKIADLEKRVGGWLDAVVKSTGRQVENVVIVDGFLIFGEGVPAELQREFDIKFMIRTPYEKAKQRREDRAGYTTMEGFWHDPPGYFELLVWPAYVKQHKYLFENGDIEAGVLTEEAKQNKLRTPKRTDQGLMETLEWAVDTLEITIVKEVVDDKDNNVLSCTPSDK